MFFPQCCSWMKLSFDKNVGNSRPSTARYANTMRRPISYFCLSYRIAATHIRVEKSITVVSIIAMTRFPTTKIRGCFFHLNQNIFRKVQGLGLQHRYQTDKKLCNYVKFF